jgi:hypothetical protein
MIPDNLGVNIHFTHAVPGELEMIAELGIKWVRMDFFWEVTEKKKGEYNFEAYEHLIKNLEAHGLRALFILDYGNPLYDQGFPPNTEEGRSAFAQWATTAVKHFEGRGIIWEIWNEPNVGEFWPPKVNKKDYIKLALKASKEIKKTAPDELLVGPAASHIPLRFLKNCFKAGLLDYWSGVTVHPYRLNLPPETVGWKYPSLQKLIKKYSPLGKNIAILSGEWGYSTTQWGIDNMKQAKFLARMWLINMTYGARLSIWYDWRDDGPNPSEKEHNFGLVRHVYESKAAQPFQKKAAYLAAKTLAHKLKGFQFSRMLPRLGNKNYITEFFNNEDKAFAFWTSSLQPRKKSIFVPKGAYQHYDFLGNLVGSVNSSGEKISLLLKDGPQYLIPVNSSFSKSGSVDQN